MTFRGIHSIVVKLVTGLAIIGMSSMGSAQSEETFQIGGSCAGLAYLNKTQIATVLASAFIDDLHSFCYPEEPSECSDYSSFMQGIGKLSTGSDDYYCSLEQ
jgi:hypothetical protein